MEINELLEKVDILDYISQYCELEEKNGEWWCLSPFKEENTPSFSVRRETGQFHDFSSGIGGNLISFVKHYHRCGFEKAVDIIKAYAGITDSDIKPTTTLSATKIAKRYAKRPQNIKESKAAPLPSNYMDRYEFNKEKLNLWQEEGISFETMKKFGVAYDSFSDRIVYPIKSYSGEIINISGRTLDKDYKEKGLRKYTYFKPLGILDTLYGFSDNESSIKEKKEIIIFEGAKSVMLAYEWGITNACALLTSHLNPQQMKFLMKLGIPVVFALDEEVNIKEDVNISKLKHYVNIEWVKNRDGLLSPKMAPVDAGFEIWNNLYERRQMFS